MNQTAGQPFNYFTGLDDPYGPWVCLDWFGACGSPCFVTYPLTAHGVMTARGVWGVWFWRGHAQFVLDRYQHYSHKQNLYRDTNTSAASCNTHMTFTPFVSVAIPGHPWSPNRWFGRPDVALPSGGI